MPFVLPSSRPLPPPPWSQAPLLRYVLCVVAGILAAWSLRAMVSNFVWQGLMLASALSCLAVGYFLKGQKFRRAAAPVGALTLFFASAALLQLSWQRMQVSWPDAPSMWIAQVNRVQRQHENGASLDVCLLRSESSYHGKIVRLRLQGDSARLLQPGDRVAFYATVSTPYRAGNPGDFDYRQYLAVHGISGTAYADDAWKRLSDPVSHGMLTRLWRYRQHLLQTYSRYFSGDELAILSALTLGDKSLLHASVSRLFSETGTSHVLALSGLHLGILFSLFNLLVLRRLRRGVWFVSANVLCVAALWLFVYMVGAPLSLLRAAWMFTLMQLGSCLRRTQNASLNNLSFAALAILLVSPLSLFDVGFQLSFTAVCSIILMHQYVWQRIPFPVWNYFDPVLGNLDKARSRGISRARLLRLRLGQCANAVWLKAIFPFIAVSLSAQLGTAPLVVYYFHLISPYALLANVIVVPAAYLLLAGSLLFFLVPVPFVQSAVAWLFHQVLGCMTGALAAISRWPGASLHFYPHWLTLVAVSLLFVGIFAFFLLRPCRRKWAVYLSAGCVVVGLCVESYRLWPGRESRQIVVYNVPRTTAIHFISSADSSYIYSSVPPDTLRQRLAYVERNYFVPHHIAYPQIIGQSPFRSNLLYGRDAYFVFARHSVYVLRQNVRAWHAAAPIPIHTLVVSYGCRDSLSVVLRHLHPHRVVLDSSLSPYYRKRWSSECLAAHIPCHDVRTQGAFVLRLP